MSIQCQIDSFLLYKKTINDVHLQEMNSLDIIIRRASHAHNLEKQRERILQDATKRAKREASSADTRFKRYYNGRNSSLQNSVRCMQRLVSRIIDAEKALNEVTAEYAKLKRIAKFHAKKLDTMDDYEDQYNKIAKFAKDLLFAVLQDARRDVLHIEELMKTVGAVTLEKKKETFLAKKETKKENLPLILNQSSNYNADLSTNSSEEVSLLQKETSISATLLTSSPSSNNDANISPNINEVSASDNEDTTCAAVVSSTDLENKRELSAEAH